jgi:hypothetical protein
MKTLVPHVTAYGGFKVAAERALLARHATGGFPATIARPAAIFGPRGQPGTQGDQVDADLQRLIDRQEIADLCVRYTFALDTKDWALLESCFTDVPAFVHPGGRLEGIEAILARTRGALESLDASQHLLGNVVADVDGDTARATSYFQAQHVRAGIPGGDTYIIAGSYTDTLTRTPDGWKIAERVQVYLWRDGNRAVVRR